MSAPMKILINVLLIIMLNVVDHMEAIQGQPPATLTEIVTPIQTVGSWLYYGNLTIRLPGGVTVERRESNAEPYVGDIIDLEGFSDKPLAPRIWIRRYRVEYESEWGMVSAFMDLLPDTTLRFCYHDSDKNVNLFTYTSGQKKGYIFHCEDDVYFVEELSYRGEYIFGGLIDDNSVRWGSGHEVGDRHNNSVVTMFDKISLGDKDFLVLRYTTEDGRRWIKLIQDGDAGVVYQSIEIAPIETPYDEWIMYKDYNFDGYLDINMSPEIFYLWDPDEKQYKKAQVPDAFFQMQRKMYYPDTEVIWGYRVDPVESENWRGSDEMEILWKWSETELVQKRVCKTQVRADGVYICAYETDTNSDIFDCSVTLEAYRQGSEEVQVLYGQFYDKMAPKEAFFNTHWSYNKDKMTWIPQGLLDKIADAMLEGTESEVLKPLIHDRVLSEEEILSVAEDNIDVRQMVTDKDWVGAYIMVEADGDNDGIMDIIALESTGGSDGSAEFVFYQGQENGTYIQTHFYPTTREEFAVIAYENKNYLCRTLFDYEKKIYNGISVMCYVDGECVEEANLMLAAKEYQPVLVECAQEQYRLYAKQITADSLTYKAEFDANETIEGNCEKKMPDYGKYQCDLNNDGIVETYKKILCHPSSIGVCAYMNFDGGGTGIHTVSDALYSLEGTPIMMWVDAVQGKNIINVMSQTGLEDFTITGFFVSGSTYEKLYNISVDATYGVNVGGIRYR